MKKIGIIMLGMLAGGMQVQGQDMEIGKVKVSCRVVDAQTNAPLEYATVSFTANDGDGGVTGGITGPDGTFETKVAPGEYTVKIDFLSYQPTVMENQSITSNTDLGTITLNPSTTSLEEVTVRAEKSHMELKLDKKVFNVGKDLASKGTSVAELLDNIPSVSVDFDGNISLRGSEGVKILIDGKPSGMVADNTAEALKMFPSSMVESVELITNPSARYDAEGTVGIINIITRKDQQRGLHGSVDVSTGIPDNHRLALNGNYRREKVNFFGSIGIARWASPSKSSIDREYFDSTGATTGYFQQEGDGMRASTDYLFRYGIDYNINETSVLTNSFSYRYGDEGFETDVHYYDYDAQHNLTGHSVRESPNTELEQDIEYNLLYEKQFTNKDHKLNANFQFIRSTEDEDLDVTETFFMEEETLLERSFNDESVTNYLFQVDYTHPFNEQEGKLEAGYKSNFRVIKSDHSIQEFADTIQEPDDPWVTLPQHTDIVEYNENIHALYGIFANKAGDFSYQLGMRLEYSDIFIDQKTLEDDENRKNYLDYFPSAHLTYEFNQQNSTQISYSRRLRRPGFWHLNPFFNYNDSRNIRTGNPDLDPEYTDAYELSYLKKWKQLTFTTSGYYRQTKGETERIELLSGDTTNQGYNVYITMPVNLTVEDVYGLELTATYKPVKELTIDWDLNYYMLSSSGSFEGVDYASESDNFRARMNAKGTLFGSTDLQMRLAYWGPRDEVQGRRLEGYYMDAGISQDILGGNGTISLNVRDVLNSRKWRSITSTDTYYSKNIYQRPGPQFRLSFSYRLNQEKERRRGNGDGGGDDMDGGF